MKGTGVQESEDEELFTKDDLAAMKLRSLLVLAADYIAIAGEWNFERAQIGDTWVSGDDLAAELTARIDRQKWRES